uniref:Uncharacterized protein n=1 Tax=Periophthalmus magnuspinnatus TaxID=409849 RepID=A0A3B4A677_9GOBI
MAVYNAVRCGTMTEFSVHIFHNSSSFGALGNGSAGASCDLTLLTCVLIGSYRFCIIPLLAASVSINPLFIAITKAYQSMDMQVWV